MALGWKVLLPTALAYTLLLALSILILDQVGLRWGFVYGLVLTVVSGIATAGFLYFLDRGHTITGAAATSAERNEVKTVPAGVAAGTKG